MTTEQPEPNSTSDHILDWLEDSVTFFPSFLDDPYHSNDIDGGLPWWDESHDLVHPTTNYTALNNPTGISIPTTTTGPPNPASLNHPSPTDSSKKQKASPEDHHIDRKNHHGCPINPAGPGDQSGEEVVVPVKKTKKGTAKGTGNNCNNGNSKEGRWAEQLLNPCASAITGGNPTRVQHLLYVLHELASVTGDANHRLAAHGLRALTQHLSSSSSSSASNGSASAPPVTFTSTEPRFFQKSLMKFYEVSPWFAFPNNIANSSILQLIAEESDRTRTLHIVDVGVSHGMQWPTLLEALTHRPGGPPPLVKITVIAAAASGAVNNQNRETPFAIGPPGDNFSNRLLSFAKYMNINLQIKRLNDQPLKTLNAQLIDASNDETLIVCVQFRLHQLNHNIPDERTEFLKSLRSMEPKGVILSENNMECSCNNCGDFATGFSRQVEYLWRFLDSTSTAFKGRESNERRLMEGEAAKALTNRGEMNEGKEKWGERMRGVGFVGEVFGEDVIDGGRALLRKYDSNWEMKVDEKDGCVGLWWKGQPVSFCSLWKPHEKVSNH